MVNGVSFGQRMNVFDKANVDAPQAHQKPAVAQPAAAPKKKHTALKVLGALAVVAAVATGLAVGAKKGAFDPAKIADLTKSFKDSKWVSWAKTPVKTVLGWAQKGGELVNQGAGYVADKATAAFKYVTGLFSKKNPAAPQPPAGLLS